MNLLVVLCCCYFCAVVTTLGSSSTCTTPNGESASCILLFNCPILLTAATNDNPLAKEFIQASACGKKNFMVCCGTVGTFTAELPNKNEENETLSIEARREFALKKLLPSRVYCGLQHTDDYFYNKSGTSVDEFPWMVYIPTRTYADYYLRMETNCVGVLISNRYVLTTKNCSTINVIIGQHHIYQDVSCVDTAYGIDDCTNPLLNEYVEKYITSETNNFALLRLDRKIDYTDFVRPICLPMPEDEKPKPADTAVTSGWGEEQNTQGKNVKIKKRIKHTILSKEECESGNPVPNPVCAETFPNSTSYVCPGDKGGALMYRYSANKNLNWVALGIITGIRSCAKHEPVVAERITPEIVNWILDNLKP